MPRKTLRAGLLHHDVLAPSMRPRPDAAENPARPRRAARTGRAAFNEAAARCRGKPLSAGTLLSAFATLQ